MKKLLGILSSMAISISAVSVTSCSLVNYEKEYIKNKVRSIVDVSNVTLRSGIINDASGINVDYLNQVIDNSRMVDMLENYQGQPQTKVKSLRTSFFNQTYDRNFYNGLSNESKSDLDLTKSLDPNTKYDSILSTLSVALAAIKSTGGIKPSLAGTLETVLPLLTSSIKEDININTNINISPEIINIVQIIINILGDSKLGELLFSVFFDVNYIKFNKIDMTYIKSFLTEFAGSFAQSTFPQLIEEYINKAMFSDYPGEGEITFAKIEQSSIIRLTNLLNKLANTPQQSPLNKWDLDKISDPNDAKKGLDYIRNDLGGAIKNIVTTIKSGTGLNTKALLTSIPDIIYIVSSLLIKLGVVNFASIEVPKDDDHLFSSSETNTNYVSQLNSQSFQNNFNYKHLIKNLALAFDSDDSNGYNMQKLLMLLFYSNFTDNGKPSPTFLPDQDKGIFGWTLWAAKNILVDPGKVGTDSFGGALLSALGAVLFDIVDVNIAIPSRFKGAPISNLLTIIVETLIFNKSLYGLTYLLKTFGIELNLSKPDQLKKPFRDAIWSKNGSLISDLTGLKIKNKLVNLSNILSLKLIANKTMGQILDDYYETLQNFDPTNYWNNKLSASLLSLNGYDFTTRWTIYDRKGNPLEEDKDLINAIIELSNKRNFGIKVSEESNTILYGTKGAMYLLGYNANTAKFEDGSLLNILENIFDDTGVRNILYSINDGLKNNVVSKNKFIDVNIMPYVKRANFTYKINSYENIDSASLIGKIKYTINYIDPFTKEKYTYLVELIESDDRKYWNLNSIKKQL